MHVTACKVQMETSIGQDRETGIGMKSYMYAVMKNYVLQKIIPHDYSKTLAVKNPKFGQLNVICKWIVWEKVLYNALRLSFSFSNYTFSSCCLFVSSLAKGRTREVMEDTMQCMKYREQCKLLHYCLISILIITFNVHTVQQ